MKAAAIHGNKSQGARQKALKSFKAGELKVLVATDIAARGIDISGLEHVVNYELPNIAETYVHRIGRTGRADASGASVSLCAADEREYLKGIEKLIKTSIPLVEDHPFTAGAEEEWSDPENRKPKKPGQRPPRNKKPRQQGQGKANRPSEGGGQRSKKRRPKRPRKN